MAIRQMIKPHGVETITRGGCEENLTKTLSSSPILICFEFRGKPSRVTVICMNHHSPNKFIATKYCFLILGDDTSVFFFLFLSFLCYFFVVKKYMYIFFTLFIFFHENFFIFSCSGMFQNVPCSWFYRRPIATQLTTNLFKTGPDS